VEDYAESESTAGPQPAHAVPQVHAVHTFLALHWTMMNSEYDAVAFSQRHNQRPRLHAWSLFGHYKFAASEIFVWL